MLCVCAQLLASLGSLSVPLGGSIYTRKLNPAAGMWLAFAVSSPHHPKKLLPSQEQWGCSLQVVLEHCFGECRKWYSCGDCGFVFEPVLLLIPNVDGTFLSQSSRHPSVLPVSRRGLQTFLGIPEWFEVEETLKFILFHPETHSTRPCCSKPHPT